jgi:hypothetical protein
VTVLHHQTLGALARLHLLRDAEERRGTWRQAMATLGGAVLDSRPAPLEGLPPADIQAAVRIALETKLLEDLDFLSPPARAACLHELSTALPAGPEKIELQKRALRLLIEGDAPTFAMLATLLALGSSRALTGGAIRARVALCLDLPIGAGARADGLALALVSRRETVREWLTEPSMGALPARRLAARLLERAAREAQRRFAQGEVGAPRVFESPEVRAAWERLFYDREPLVWRHVAAARGLLTGANEDLAVEIHRHTDTALTPTEWRRAATSLAASLAVDPASALKACVHFLKSPVFQKDRGIAGSMALGLPRAVEAEPAAVAELLPTLIARGDIDALEALSDLRREHVAGGLDEASFIAASDRAKELFSQDPGIDDGRAALFENLIVDLAGGTDAGGPSIAARIDDAVMRYASMGSRAAADEARAVLALVGSTLETMEKTDDDTPEARRASFRAFSELDTAILEKATLNYLLQLDEGKHKDSYIELLVAQDRIAKWLFAREGKPITDNPHVEHLTYRLRRMRTWLHLVDAETSSGDGTVQPLHEETLNSARLLLGRIRDDLPTKLERVTCAACSRACDALVREEFFEVSDTLLVASMHATHPKAVETFGEASVVPDIKLGLSQYASLRRCLDEAPPTDTGRDAVLKVMQELANSLPISSTPRLEALRQTLLSLTHSLDTVQQAKSLARLKNETGTSRLAELEVAVGGLARLAMGAMRRLGVNPPNEEILSTSAIRELDFAVERARRGSMTELDETLTGLREKFTGELPPYLADGIVFMLDHLREIPVDAPETTADQQAAPAQKNAPLPPWLPPGRTLGSFYVLRVLGTGAVGSVFVATRIEDRYKRDPQKFALKVPEYAGAAARELSEQEFHSVFRQEAGALLALPDHPHLARLVTFDAGAQPKPILVMELVEGPSIERMIRLGDMTVDRAFDLLDGITTGLESMHKAGIGHLDVKPSNVILREARVGTLDNPAGVPVLVDFGLAGRNVRPGCATGEYGAPEVWGAMGRGAKLQPMPVDVYALGCLIYEIFTGRTLFTGPSEIALVTLHISHDGNPMPLLELAQKPDMGPLAEVLTGCLRHKPDDRLTITEVREKLHGLRASLSSASWPLAV